MRREEAASEPVAPLGRTEQEDAPRSARLGVVLQDLEETHPRSFCGRSFRMWLGVQEE